MLSRRFPGLLLFLIGVVLGIVTSPASAQTSSLPVIIDGEVRALGLTDLRAMTLERVEGQREFKVREFVGRIDYVNPEIPAGWTGGFEYLENSSLLVEEWISAGNGNDDYPRHTFEQIPPSFLTYRSTHKSFKMPLKAEFAFSLRTSVGVVFGVCGAPKAEFGSRCRIYFAEGNYLFSLELSPNEFIYAGGLIKQIKWSFRIIENEWKGNAISPNGSSLGANESLCIKSHKVILDEKGDFHPGYVIVPQKRIRRLYYDNLSVNFAAGSFGPGEGVITDFGLVVFTDKTTRRLTSHEIDLLLKDMHHLYDPVPLPLPGRQLTEMQENALTWGEVNKDQETAIRWLISRISADGGYVRDYLNSRIPLSIYTKDESQGIMCHKGVQKGTCRGVVVAGTIGMYAEFVLPPYN